MTDPWHLGMLCAFDTETTGPEPDSARIVTACIAYVDGEGKIPPESVPWLIAPGRGDPGGSRRHPRHHHATRPRARPGRRPGGARRSAANCSARRQRRSRLIAFNAPYDFTVLDRETRRHGVEPFGARNWRRLRRWSSTRTSWTRRSDPYRKGGRTLGDRRALRRPDRQGARRGRGRHHRRAGRVEDRGGLPACRPHVPDRTARLPGAGEAGPGHVVPRVSHQDGQGGAGGQLMAAACMD